MRACASRHVRVSVSVDEIPLSGDVVHLEVSFHYFGNGYRAGSHRHHFRVFAQLDRDDVTELRAGVFCGKTTIVNFELRRNPKYKAKALRIHNLNIFRVEKCQNPSCLNSPFATSGLWHYLLLTKRIAMRLHRFSYLACNMSQSGQSLSKLRS